MSSIEKLEEDLSYEVDIEEVPPNDVVAYNELRSAADLCRLHGSGALDIQPDFQREIVWSNADQSRFIDSLMKQLPIPSMCFSLDYRTQKWEVIDGLQRMWSIIKFFNDEKWTLASLQDIDKRISGKTVGEIRTRYPDLYRRVENVSLPITILRCDYSKKNHAEYIFMIFHRLNAGGTKLNNQEIRNAVYQGVFNNFLKDCSKFQEWRNISGSRLKRRFRDIELILRFFAFFDHLNSYNGNLALFLNEYMQKNRNTIGVIDGKRILFTRVINVINNKFSEIKLLTNASNTVVEGALYGVSKNLDFLEGDKVSKLDTFFKKMIAAEAFSEKNIREGIARKEKVLSRLEVAQKIFSGK